ncbi:hypothetical protein IFM89_012478 [Coptis chinensis]|uniref:Kri1-like C-terminal domain-containing protein n=1 Tax=Coptis chinensis TaxID=261450 RepID=A0A835LUU2_9MAGN|nr:hypothetical protein IFM89_012478 [Coptis chinensis]
MGINLFDDSDDVEEISKIETNKDFAKRYEHNKKREDLHRYEELKKKQVISSGSEDESESESDDESDLKSDAKLFQSDEEEGGNAKAKKKEKPMGSEKLGVKKSYNEEQEELRKSFLDASKGVFDSEDDGDLLTEKKRNEGEDEDDYKFELNKKVKECYGEEMDENEKFLHNFLLEKSWIEKDKGKKPYNEDLLILSEDEEEIEKQERYEAVFNFRFEEGAGDRVLGHARVTEGSVRKKNNARKLQRKNKEERMAQAEFQRKEELKHLKNLKKKEIEEKLEKIRAIAGLTEDGTCKLNVDDLEEDFDPEEYDRKMNETFDVDYYQAEEVDPSFGSDDDKDGDGIEKPDFDKEDELLGLSKDWGVGGSGDGFWAAREKVLKLKAEKKDVDVSVNNEQGEEDLPGESKRKMKHKIPFQEKVAFDKELEEYYKLDYEDTIEDLKTRFKYTSVPSRRFGLNPVELVMTDEKELNQYVSVKKLAPYREKEWKVPSSKRYSQKMKNNLGGEAEDLKDKKSGNKHKRKSDGPEAGSAEKGETQVDESNGEVGVRVVADLLADWFNLHTVSKVFMLIRWEESNVRAKEFRKCKLLSLNRGCYIDGDTNERLMFYFKKGELTSDAKTLTQSYTKMAQESALDVSVKGVVDLVLGSEWNDDVEKKLGELDVKLSENVLLRIMI